jgi:hypothetical protein
MIELFFHISMTPMLIFLGSFCWFIASSQKMSNIYTKYEPKRKLLRITYKSLLGIIILGVMNIALALYIAYGAWIYNF